jgi:hypothetical protein
MSRITILNNNTIMKNGVVFTVPGQSEGPAKVLPNGKTAFQQPDIEEPFSVEEAIDNVKEANLEKYLWGENA